MLLVCAEFYQRLLIVVTFELGVTAHGSCCTTGWVEEDQVEEFIGMVLYPCQRVGINYFCFFSKREEVVGERCDFLRVFFNGGHMKVGLQAKKRCRFTTGSGTGV